MRDPTVFVYTFGEAGPMRGCVVSSIRQGLRSPEPRRHADTGSTGTRLFPSDARPYKGAGRHIIFGGSIVGRYEDDLEEQVDALARRVAANFDFYAELHDMGGLRWTDRDTGEDLTDRIMTRVCYYLFQRSLGRDPLTAD